MSVVRIGRGAFVAALTMLLTLVGGSVFAQVLQGPKPRKLVLGEVESLIVNDMRDPASGGRIVVNGKEITIPSNLSIGLPSGRIALTDLMLDASEQCRAQEPAQSGLATSDSCRGDKPPALARVMVQPDANGTLVADLVIIQADSALTLSRIKPQLSPRATRKLAEAARKQGRDPQQ
jgi:hypothetical protein